jgi:hypothetical protein
MSSGRCAAVGVAEPFIFLTSFSYAKWFKPLNPWQVNAVKSLVSPEALADATHPLRGPGDVRNLELFVGEWAFINYVQSQNLTPYSAKPSFLAARLV